MLLLNAFMLIIGILGPLVFSADIVQGILVVTSLFNRVLQAAGKSAQDTKTALHILGLVCNGLLLCWGLYDAVTGTLKTEPMEIGLGIVIVAVAGVLLRPVKAA